MVNVSKQNNKVKNYKFLPLLGLQSISLEETKNADIFNAISYAEEKINSSPKGRVKELAFLFYVIDILTKAKIDFYVKGGVILNYYLGDRVRETHDLDIVTYLDGDTFANKVKEAFSNINDGIELEVIKCSTIKADSFYYYDTFTIEVEVIYQGEQVHKLQIDGITNDFYKSIVPLDYDIPKFISDRSFKGVPVEYVLAEKITAITNELPRPFKHLIDVYSLIHINININLTRKLLDLILENDNNVRKRLNLETKTSTYQIGKNKRFVDDYIFPLIQAGYVISLDNMIEEVNNWLKFI